MTTGLCITCGDPIVVARNGRALTPRATRLGLYDPDDGEQLTQRQITERIRITDLAGHSAHVCADGQAVLVSTVTNGTRT